MKILLNINRYLAYCIMLIIFSVTACTDKYDEYNTNPEGFTDEDLERDYMNAGGSLIPQMQMHIFPIGSDSNPYQRMQNLMGDIYSGYFGATNFWGNNSNGCTYYLLDEWNQVPFQETFTSVMPAWKQIKEKTEVKNPPVYAVAQIIKVMAAHRATDIYGPLPYLDFGHGGLTTPYNSQEDIYRSFFEDLDAAIAVLEEQIEKYPTAKPLAKFDLVYGGDYLKWVKFANSLKLRLAMRLSYVDAANARKYAEQAVNSKHGVLTSNSDNAYLAPANGITFAHPLKMIWDDYGDTRMGANMESFLTGYNDARVSAYFNKAAYTGSGSRDYMGVRNGININASRRTGYLGYSIPNINEQTPVLWMTAAEMYFLRAEGVLRKWNMGGTAEELYNLGITTSFEQHNVAGAAAYAANSTAKPAAYTDPVFTTNNIPAGNAALSTITIKWDDAATFETNLERIITQKWIAMFPDGQEAWSEFRRTHYPRVFPNVVNNSSNAISTSLQIRRIKYPVSEYNNNKEETNKAVNNPLMLDGPDTGGTNLWWDKNPQL